MLNKFAVTVATGLIATSAFAVSVNTPEKSYVLKDGATVYVFADGKMGMEDKLGNTFLMDAGQAMETRDGQKIAMKGNEVGRVQWRDETRTP